MAQAKTFSVGDRVAFSARFLRSIACFTGEKPFLRGTVVALDERTGSLAPAPARVAAMPQLVTVAWDARLRIGGLRVESPDESRVLACNLTLESRIAFDAAL